MSWRELGLKGSETVTIEGIATLSPLAKITARIAFADGSAKDVPLICRIDTLDELAYFKNGGILPYVLRNLAAA
jgi:aconitate hydratase